MKEKIIYDIFPGAGVSTASLAFLKNVMLF
jgi:hypothetical protein